MALGKFLKSLFGDASAGGGQPSPSEAIDYEGFAVEAAPINEDGKYRTAGFISGEIDGESRRVRFIRADQHADLDSAVKHSITKARQIIDEQGKSLLNKTQL
ncbi:MAG TPA: HlyU family transcriptional regulator [Gammaproteobacteria bacterium]|nr:HlyU family transcriptional regulator [Gammaproteobacteria bacterium]